MAQIVPQDESVVCEAAVVMPARSAAKDDVAVALDSADSAFRSSAPVFRHHTAGAGIGRGYLAAALSAWGG